MFCRLGVVLALLLCASSLRADLVGEASVTDGDTLVIGAERVRLHGIDAPESAQRCDVGSRRWACGEVASAALRAHIGARPVVCSVRGRDSYGRAVAVCRVAGADINAWMVSEGWAVAYRRYSSDYVGQEAVARASRRGVWRGPFVAPVRWRRGERLEAGAPDRPPGCEIKGNVSRSGARVYHVPGGRWYARTRVDASGGERWFCTEAQARAAGWRKAER